jgi:glycosyltransferase involved in cell wall biosynthesis
VSDSDSPQADLEVSVVMPCLNESDTIGLCVAKAWSALRDSDIRGEVVVADNGSRDDSARIAASAGARVVQVSRPGYGSALMGGIEASRGKFVVMGDADDSYDFAELPKFIEKLRANVDLVQGCRLPRGGGAIKPGAMPWLHRWLGNPFLSWLVRRMFGVPIHDIYCGMRGFTRSLYDRLDLRCPGMEFATEMIIKAHLLNALMTEVPITLHRDGRKSHGSHLRTFQDGWRTLRLFLIYSPRWSFLYPGLILISLGMIGYALSLPQIKIMGAALDVHTLLIASLLILLGWQFILMAGLARIFATREGLLPMEPRVERISVEQGLIASLISVISGKCMIGYVVCLWWQKDFGALDYPFTMRWVVPGVTLMALGFQTLMAALLAGVLRLHRARSDASK